MDGPERLEDDARPARRRAWLVVAVALVVVAGLGVARFAGPTPEPDPPAPSASGDRTGTSTTTWPGGLPAGVLYALDGNGVQMVDTSTGSVRRSSLGVGTSAPTITAAATGVLVWSRDSHSLTHLVDAGLPDPVPVTGALARARQFLPNGATAVWASTTAPASTGGSRTWRLVDDDLRVRAETELRGPAVTDGSGGLLELTGGQTIRWVRLGKPVETWRGVVLAVGPDGVETLRCGRDGCRLVIRDGTGRELPARGDLSSDLATGALAPGNRYVAAVEHATASPDSPVIVRVVDTSTGRELRDFPVTTGAYGMTWLDDRWLAASSDHGLVLYDALQDRLVSPGSGLVDVGVLVFRGAR